MKKSKDAAKPAKDHAPKAKSCSKGHRKNGGESRLGSGEASHPETLTPDLILHAMMHVQSWSSHGLRDEVELFDLCYRALKSWNEKLKNLSQISLSTVLEYALLLKQDRKHADLSLEEAGNIVIATTVLAFNRLPRQLDAEKRAAEQSRILSSKDCISPYQAARDVTGDEISTRAVRKLKFAVVRLRQDYVPIRSEPQIGKLVQMLEDILTAWTKADLKRKIIPRELVRIFTPFLQSVLRQKTSDVRRIAAKKSHQSRKTRKQAR